MTFKRLDVPRAAAPLAYLALALLIYFDALLTYIAAGHLGAYEVVLRFVNQTPSAIWLVAAAKNADVLYLMLKRRRHPWLDYAALVVAVNILGVLAPAYRAGRLNIVDALRYE